MRSGALRFTTESSRRCSTPVAVTEARPSVRSGRMLDEPIHAFLKAGMLINKTHFERVRGESGTMPTRERTSRK